VKLSSDHFSRYSNKLNQLLQENIHITTILLRKWCHNNKHFAELAHIRHRYEEITSLSPYVHCNGQSFLIQTLLSLLSPYRFLADTPTTIATSATNAALVQVITSSITHDTQLHTSEW